ncbi:MULTISPECIES: 2-hydroxychromene-2-carboxylate isomerase [Thalassobaculum]|uniref:2-hydroxychromene-2-carboxylate isomerase n=1 Tax=Thalassobaculum litoreum DSM 18839 TaxID=1123362 RepID=A0A8G2EZ47_9PROT|nr:MULTISPECIES: 2-hydroxychromene-2-carboxylate isomerase [Thalassobaculum]SDF92696.1 2-hydroxychromene-2-carboxylate isomerase [Thalassobaculum litoreum DSM 18839]
MSLHIDYYISTSSPWSYLGSGRFMEIVKQTGATVGVHAVDFGAVFAVSGGLPLPKRAPQRQAYRMMEMKRWRDNLGIPLVLEPKAFPITTPISSLAIIAARESGADALALSDALLTALWRDNRDTGDTEVVKTIADETGLDGAAIIEAAPTYNDQLTADTQKAINSGVFGAPSYVLPDGEIFWGQDRIDLLRWRLGL